MNKEKHVDESWKENASMEKDQNEGLNEEKKDHTCNDSCEHDAFKMNFFNYVTSLAFQAMIFLGEIPNPMDDNKIEKNLKQAKFLIDTLILLKEKTKGNLTKEEDEVLNSAVYELEMKYVDQLNSAEK